MTHEHLELIERTRRMLKERDLPCAIAGAADDAAIDAAEAEVGCPLPPSYRRFLREVGGLTLPHRLSTIHHFIGLAPTSGMVERTLTARTENRLGKQYLIVALGAEAGEWFVLDTDRVRDDGEGPIYLFDARDNQLDQIFYDDFGAMISEVLQFVIENLEENLDLDLASEASDASGETSVGGLF